MRLDLGDALLFLNDELKCHRQVGGDRHYQISSFPLVQGCALQAAYYGVAPTSIGR
jgi:hypothetical protein